MVLVVVLAAANVSAMSTIGYDCGTKTFGKLDITTYSLLNVHSCNHNAPVIETKTFIGQIVQTKLYNYRTVFQCKVKVTRTIRRCSWFNNLKPVENGLQEFLIDISRDQCKKMHYTRSFAYDFQHILTDLKINATTVRSVSLAGNAIDNKCNVGSYSDRFGTWNEVNVEGLIKVTLTSYVAKVDINGDQILLRSGIGCKYSETNCLDVKEGYSFWDTLQSEDCVESKLEVLYEGPIQAVTETRMNISKIHYFVEHNQALAALKNNGIHDICHVKFIKTEFSNLYIIEDKVDFLRVKGNTPDLYTYINAKFVYVEGKSREQMEQLYIDILNRKCESDQEILKESLSLAYLSPDLFAYNLMGPGYMAHVAGELIHIVKCLAIEVEIRENLKTCYKQIPINYNDQELFLSAKTNIVIKNGIETKCNRILPISFYVDGKWITFSPELRIIDPPNMLSPDNKNYWTPTEIKDLADGGIYTEAEMRDYMRKISFPIEREAILENTATNINKQTEERKENGYSFNPFAIGYWKALISGYWLEFEHFGTISAGIFMIFIIIYLIIQGVGVILRGVALHRMFGFSLRLLGAFLGSLTQFFLIVGQKNDMNENEHELQEIKVVKNVDVEPTSIKRNNLQPSYPTYRLPVPNPRLSLISKSKNENENEILDYVQIHETKMVPDLTQDIDKLGHNTN